MERLARAFGAGGAPPPQPTVLVTSRCFPETIAILESTPAVVVANPGPDPFEPAVLRRHASAAAGMLAFMPDCIDQEFLRGCPRLQVVGCALKGYDNVDVLACSAAGVRVTYVPRLLTEPTAELAVGLKRAHERAEWGSVYDAEGALTNRQLQKQRHQNEAALFQTVPATAPPLPGAKIITEPIAFTSLG